MATIFYQGDDRVISVADSDRTILDVSISAKIPHVRECGGVARCTTCRIRIRDGIEHVSPRTRQEREIAESLGWDRFTRLACQTRVHGDVTLERLIRSGADLSRVQVEGASAAAPVERALAVLFCDIRGFTRFVDAHLPFDVVHILNRFFEAVGDAILVNNGVIYQYVGDQVIGLFGVDGDPAGRSCLAAVRTGLGILDSLNDLNAELSVEFATSLEIGIGAHFGELVVGSMGHSDDRRFTVIGDAMNIASRIEEANKTLGTRLLVSKALHDHVGEVPLEVRPTQAVLKGKDGTFPLVEIVRFAEADPALLVQSTIGILLQNDERFTKELYRRLFASLPLARTLFRGDMGSQGKMLSHMLQFLVYAMGRPGTMQLGLEDLGRRHRAYGVTAEHYPYFRQAFLESAREILGDRHTPEVEAAWGQTIDRISAAMLGATARNEPGAHEAATEAT